MQPNLRKKIENLLSRKIARSLDEYTFFFCSLIAQFGSII